jgi:hypothetical protein
MSSLGQIISGVVGLALTLIPGVNVAWYVGLGIGLTVGGILFPSSADVEEPKPSDIQIQTSTYGSVIKVVHGQGKIAANLVKYARFTAHEVEQESGGSGGDDVVVGHTYTVSLVWSLCMAPAARRMFVKKCWAGKDEVDSSKYRYYDGSQTTPDPHVVQMLTDEGRTRFPVWKNLLYVVMEDFDLGSSPHVPNFNWEVSEYYTQNEWKQLIIESSRSVGYVIDDTAHEIVVLNTASRSVLTTIQLNPSSGFSWYRTHFFDEAQDYLYVIYQNSGDDCEIFQIDLSTHAIVNENIDTGNVGDIIMNGVGDGTYIYCGNADNKLYKFTVSDLTWYATGGPWLVNGETVGTGGGQGLAIEGDNIWACGSAAAVGRISASKLTLLAGSTGWGGGPIYCCNWFGNMNVHGDHIYFTINWNPTAQRACKGNKWSVTHELTLDNSFYNQQRLIVAPDGIVYILAFQNFFPDQSAMREITNGFPPYMRELSSIIGPNTDDAWGTQMGYCPDSDQMVTLDYVSGYNVMYVFNRLPLEWPSAYLFGKTETTPPDVTEDFLTNTLYGLGRTISAGDLDSAVFAATKSYCESNDFYVSMQWETQISVLDMLRQVISHHNGYISYFDGKIAHNQLKAEIPLATISLEPGNQGVRNEKEFASEVVKSGGREYFNWVTVQYRKADQDWTQGTAVVYDRVDSGRFGRRDTIVNLQGITLFTRASKLANILLKKSLFQPEAINFALSAQSWGLRPGEVYELTDSGIELNQQDIRIQSISEEEIRPRGKKKKTKFISVVAQEEIDVYDLPAVGSDSTPPPPQTKIFKAAGHVENPMAVEVPAAYSGSNCEVAIIYSKSLGSAWAGASIYKAYSTDGNYVSITPNPKSGSGITGRVIGVGSGREDPGEMSDPFSIMEVLNLSFPIPDFEADLLSSLVPSEYSTVLNTTFEEYDLYETPNDWTEQWHTDRADYYVVVTESEYGDKCLRIQSSGAERYALSWNPAGNLADLEIYSRVRFTKGDYSEYRIYARGSGDDTAEDAYFVDFNPDSNTMKLQKYVSGSMSQIGTNLSFTLNVDTWYWVRFRLESTALKYKVWAGDLTSEPTDWDKEETDSSHTTGWCGVGQWDTGSSGTECDYFNVEPLNQTLITFTRSGIAHVYDFEALYKQVLSGEARFLGARRVRNLVSRSNEFDHADWSKSNGINIWH